MPIMLLFNIGNTHTQWVKADISGKFISPIECLDTSAWQQDLTLLPAVDDSISVYAASVVPCARKILTQSNIYKKLNWIDAVLAERAGLDFSLMDTSTLGADRIANAAALLDYPLPAANFDCGTAITLEIVNEKRQFAGGAILPGRKLMRLALAQGTAALPEIPLSDHLPSEPGRNTVQAMTLGIDRGAVGMVRELIDTAKACQVKTFLVSGGDAAFFLRALPELAAGGEDYTLRGIAAIARKNLQY